MILRNFKIILAAFSIMGSVSFAKVDSNRYVIHPGEMSDDSQLVSAVNNRRGVFYLEAGNVVVSKLLPDDNAGLPHQKWVAQLSNGGTVQVIYNSDMGDRVPVRVGDKFGVGGQFIWSRTGGLVHWVHADPSGRRPDGYVFYNGEIYGGASTGRAGMRRYRH